MGIGRRTVAVAAGTVLGIAGAMLGTSTAAAAEPYECPDTLICIFENADGTGASFPVEIRWEGGFKLAPSGWDNRASSVYNNSDYTHWLYSTTPSGECWILRDTIGPHEKRAVASEADKNFDLVANSEFLEC